MICNNEKQRHVSDGGEREGEGRQRERERGRGKEGRKREGEELACRSPKVMAIPATTARLSRKNDSSAFAHPCKKYSVK